MRSASTPANSSATARATRNRLAAVHASPMLRIFATMAASTAAPRSASSKTTKAALPPSSSDRRRRLCAAPAMSTLPVSVEPVKESLRSRRSCRSGPTTSAGDEVVTTLSTPAGSPASASTAASASIDSGVCSAGLTTIVQPAATAGAILRAPMASGKFQGVTSRHGPTGWCMVRMRPHPSGATDQPPSMRTASSENQRRNLPA
jgi:hypothetical protein